MGSGVEKVDSAGGGSQHRDAARLRQLRALRLTLLVAVLAAAPLAAQQEQQRVVRGLSFEGNHAIDDYTLGAAIATTNSSAFATKWYLRWIRFLGEKRYFNELEFRRDVVRLLLLYRQSGYMNAVIDTLVRREGRDAYIKFRIYEGDPVRLAELHVLGLDSILDVQRLQRDLYGLGMFRSVNVVLADTTPPPGDSTVRVVVHVAEAPRHRIRLGAGYGSLDCFRVQSGWTAYDFLGGARSLDVTGQLSKIGVGVPTDANFKENVCRFLQADSTSDTLNYNATVTLRQPAFLSPRHTASFAVFAERRSEFKAYMRQAVGANVAVTFNARRDVPGTVGYGYSVGR